MSDALPINNGVGKRSVFIDTLGCKVNLFESEYIYSQLDSQRWERSDDQIADLCIVNTCTVTKAADRQSRQSIRRAIRKNPDAKIVVTGCYAEMSPDDCVSIPGVDLVVPGSQKLQIPRLLSGQLDSLPSGIRMTSSPVTEVPAQVIDSFESRSRAFLQIQQGCDNGCTFCIIHKARGPSRSVLPTTVTRQIEKFIEQGFLEIVICGIDVGSYGEDLSEGLENPMNLASLLQEVATRYDQCRFRISSIDPSHITSELVTVFSQFKNICPHIHLSLQSASPIILKRMKRRYSEKDLYRVVHELRHVRPELVLSADVMVGFPTESELDFELTKTAVKELEIPYPHVFVYSEREDTPAARIPKQIPLVIRKQRAKQLRDTGAKVLDSVRKRFIGKKVLALVEGSIDQKSNLFRARLDNYIPVYFESNGNRQNGLEWMNIVGIFRDGLRGQRIEGKESLG